MTAVHLADGAETAEQLALREAVRAVVRSRPDASAWQHLASGMGLTGLAVPVECGGAGAGLAEVAIVVEETGRRLLPVPYLSSALAAALLPADSPHLAGLLDGACSAALALDADATFDRDRVTGAARSVLDGAAADVLLVRAGGELVAVAAGDVAVTPVDTLDQTRTQADLRIDSAPAERTGVDPARAEQFVQALLAAEAAATAQHCLAVTVEYLKQRVQFGRPIGAFQALRHRCADLAVEVASAQATARAAVRAAVVCGPELAVIAPLAKRHCADVFLHVAGEMIQLHGGIGFTWEHDAHRYFKRAKATQLLHGTSAQLRRVVAEQAGLT